MDEELDRTAQRLEILLSPRQIYFVRDDAPGPLRKARIVEIDFAPQILEILNRMATFAAGDIEDEKQHAAPRDVPEKIVAKPDVSMRALD